MNIDITSIVSSSNIYQHFFQSIYFSKYDVIFISNASERFLQKLKPSKNMIYISINFEEDWKERCLLNFQIK